MKKKTVILGFETSCDETAVSVLVDKGNKKVEVLSNVVSLKWDAFVSKEDGNLPGLLLL